MMKKVVKQIQTVDQKIAKDSMPARDLIFQSNQKTQKEALYLKIDI